MRPLEAVFFFQAEDGIRDLVRSRGLGDVYKRQAADEWRDLTNGKILARELYDHATAPKKTRNLAGDTDRVGAVSYTHLTLPTSDLV